MILVAGSANIDFVTPVDHLPAPGETVLGTAYTLSAGGKGANQAVACARAGGQVRFLGRLGDDPFAAQLRASFSQSGVSDLSLTDTLPTGAAFISVSREGENAITVASGANSAVAAADLPELEGVAFLMMQLEIPLVTVTAFARAARAAGTKVLLNASPAQSLSADLLTRIDVLVVNEQELATLTAAGQGGERTVLEQVQAARRLGPQTVVVTLGGRGSLALGPGGWVELPAHQVKVLDTTGAGDTYAGVLTAGLDAGLPLESAMRRASVAAALACTRAGAQPSMPWEAEIEAALGTGSLDSGSLGPQSL
ncbi:ribokinase [Deinococcus sp.]|uniref:ribokinase n=1 Tax=Deinococcus sp. TaxID=47478 RepID=UPI003C7A1FD3